MNNFPEVSLRLAPLAPAALSVCLRPTCDASFLPASRGPLNTSGVPVHGAVTSRFGPCFRSLRTASPRSFNVALSGLDCRCALRTPSLSSPTFSGLEGRTEHASRNAVVQKASLLAPVGSDGVRCRKATRHPKKVEKKGKEKGKWERNSGEGGHPHYVGSENGGDIHTPATTGPPARGSGTPT